MLTIFNTLSIPSFHELLSRPQAAWAVQKQQRWAKKPLETQLSTLQSLLQKAKHTLFGHAHRFNTINSYRDFKQLVPVRDYKGLALYISKIEAGAGNVLWPGRPLYLIKTAGTTGEAKYIPVTSDSLPAYVQTMQHSLLSYIHETGKTGFLNKKMVDLAASSRLSYKGSVPTGDWSDITAPYVPNYLQRNQLPSYATKCIESWPIKLDAIVEETHKANVGLIAGAPAWIQMYVDQLQQRTDILAKTLFPGLSLLVHSGMSLVPYKSRLLNSLGTDVDLLETYTAAEGLIAFQDSQDSEGLLLQLNSGMFFEFIPVKEYATTDNPNRLCIDEIELDVDYVLVLSTNAGLWAYAPGDTVKFVSKNPYRIIVTGRTEHFVDAFGEYVTAQEVDEAMKFVLAAHAEAVLSEFTVAPKINEAPNAPSHHEWLVEFLHPPKDIIAFAQGLDQKMCQLNDAYRQLRTKKVLQPLRLKHLPGGAFLQHMKVTNTLGGQHKIVRLANNRMLADTLLSIRP